MNWLYWQPQLSALALLEAYRHGSFDAGKSILETTSAGELHNGLVQLAEGLLASLAAANGVTPDEMADVFRQGMLKAAVAE